PRAPAGRNRAARDESMCHRISRHSGRPESLQTEDALLQALLVGRTTTAGRPGNLGHTPDRHFSRTRRAQRLFCAVDTGSGFHPGCIAPRRNERSPQLPCACHPKRARSTQHARGCHSDLRCNCRSEKKRCRSTLEKLPAVECEFPRTEGSVLPETPRWKELETLPQIVLSKLREP